MTVLVMQGITANVAQRMTWGFTLDNSAGECFHLAVDCSIMPTQTVLDTSRCKSLFRKHKKLNLKKLFSC